MPSDCTWSQKVPMKFPLTAFCTASYVPHCKLDEVPCYQSVNTCIKYAGNELICDHYKTFSDINPAVVWLRMTAPSKNATALGNLRLLAKWSAMSAHLWSHSLNHHHFLINCRFYLTNDNLPQMIYKHRQAWPHGLLDQEIVANKTGFI